jgi:hydrogenase maturation protein HypF
LQALDGSGQPIPTDEPLAVFVTALRAGRVGALKGLGGYHLVCDARGRYVYAKGAFRHTLHAAAARE